MIRLFKSVFGFIAGFVQSVWRQYTPFGQMLFVIALAALAIDASISYEYGVSMTTLHGYGFAIVAITFCILPDVASVAWSKGKYAAAVIIGLGCIPLGIVAYQSHIGYGAGVRVGDIQQAAVQNAKHDDGRDAVAELRSKAAFLESRAKDLDAELTHLVAVKIGGWTVSTRPADPAALDGLIEAKALEVENESKRGGCKSKCEARTNELAHLKALRATAQKIAENDAQHTAALEGLAKARTAAAAIAYESSTVVNQNGVFAKLFKAASGESPDEAIKADQVTQEFVNIFTAGSGALAFMIVAPMMMFAAGLNRKPEFDPEPTQTRIPTASSVPAIPSTRTIVERVTETATKSHPFIPRTISLCHA